MIRQKKKLIGEIIKANLKRKKKDKINKEKKRKEKEKKDSYAALPHVHSLPVMMKGHPGCPRPKIHRINAFPSIWIMRMRRILQLFINPGSFGRGYFRSSIFGPP